MDGCSVSELSEAAQPGKTVTQRSEEHNEAACRGHRLLGGLLNEQVGDAVSCGAPVRCVLK